METIGIKELIEAKVLYVENIIAEIESNINTVGTSYLESNMYNACMETIRLEMVKVRKYRTILEYLNTMLN